jgi:hypothetical protein
MIIVKVKALLIKDKMLLAVVKHKLDWQSTERSRGQARISFALNSQYGLLSSRLETKENDGLLNRLMYK